MLPLFTLLFAPNYVEAPMPLAAVIQQSSHVCTMAVAKIDKQKNLIVYRKVADIKGKHPQDEIKHNIGFGGLRPGEWQEIMNWAEVGKTAVFFHNGGASETYTGTSWYQAYPQGEWWGMSHGEPFLLRSYAGKVEKLGPAVADLIAGKDILLPCMADGDKEALHKKTAKVQRLKASLKVLDYNPQRDFAGWGGDDIRRLAGMPGFDKLAAVGNPGPEPQAASVVDFTGDGKPDLVLVGPHQLSLLANTGDGFAGVALPGFTGGARAAVWADHDGDGRPDLLLATPTGPRLFTNLGGGQIRDDSKLLPVEPCYNLTGAAWLDADGDGKPDVLLANGWHGLKLYRNARDDKAPVPPKFGPWRAVGPFRAANNDHLGSAFGPETANFDPAKTYTGKRDADVTWADVAAEDGKAASLTPFGNNCAVYLRRELTCAAAGPVTLSVAATDGLTAWANGAKVFTGKAAGGAAIAFDAKAGVNVVVLKLAHGDGDWGFTFGGPGASAKPFVDVTAAFGLDAVTGKGDAVCVADFTGDGRADVLYSANGGTLLVGDGKRFAVKADAGISFAPGVGPVAADFDGDGHLDLFVPQATGPGKLYRNNGTGKFTDVAATSGALSQAIPGAVGAAWGDFDGDGKPDLFVACLRGPNRYFRNDGGGKFTDRTGDIGLTLKRFNSRAAAVADVNGDGVADVVFANEGQDSVVLFGAAAKEGTPRPLAVSLPGAGARVRVLKDGQAVASAMAGGADGRGGQSGLEVKFALPPGAYSVEVTGRPVKAVVVK